MPAIWADEPFPGTGGTGDGQTNTGQTPDTAGEKWLNCYVKAPAGEFKIVARDASETAWFAFKAPREVGRLSFWADRTSEAWKYLLFAGLGFLLLDLATCLLRGRTHEGFDLPAPADRQPAQPPRGPLDTGADNRTA